MWTVITTVGSRSPAEALAAFRGDGLPGKVVRWELGDLTLGRSLPLTTLVVLFETPVLSPLLRAAAEPEPSPAPLPGSENVQPEPAALFLRQPRRPPLGCAGRRGVHPAPGPSPGPEGPPRGVHSKPPGVGRPEPALLVWACLPSGWDAPGQGAQSALTPVSPGPVRFVD